MASFTTTSPVLRATAPDVAVDGFTNSGTPIQAGAHVDLDCQPRDKPNPRGNTYRQPSTYTIKNFDGTAWVDVADQARTPAVPQANLSLVTLPQIEAQRVRVRMTRTGDFGFGVQAIQVFDALS